MRTLALLCASLLLLACDPEPGCDPGYIPDHGLCVLPTKPPPVDDADGGSEGADSGSPFANDDSDFGRACEVQSDCGGNAPECAAPWLPLCTAVNCMQGTSQCPVDWMCVDISKWDRPFPEILSICLQY
jgi:hypothetical protein